jgi:hypothetical protein
MANGEFFKQSPVIAWFNLGDREIVGTVLSGLYIKTNNQWKEWNCAASEFLKKNQLNRCVTLNDSIAILGTISNGAILIDNEGQILDNINMAQGIQNNTILSVLVDLEQNIWLGLDNGISFIEANSPFRYINDFSGQLGTAYDAVLFDDFLYVGTNHGLFYYPDRGHQSERSNICFVEGTQGQVWDLLIKDNQLLCGHNNGTFIISKPGGHAVKTSPISGGWCFADVNESRMVQGTYVGLAVFNRETNGQWKYSHRVADFYEPVRYVALRSNDVIWASHNQKGVYKIQTDSELKKAEKVTYYGKEKGFPEEYNIHVFKIRDRIVFTTSQGFYTYDELNDRIIPFDKLNAQCQPNENQYRVITDKNNNYWFISKANARLYSINPDYELKLLTHFATPSALKIDNYENISSLGDYSCFTLDNGLMTFSDKIAPIKTNSPIRYKLIKVSITKSNKENETLLSTQPDVIPELKSKQNNINFTFTNATYTALPHKYEVMLAELETEWSQPFTSGQKSYQNLPPGTYEFLVKVAGLNNGIYPLYRFEIKPPWYISGYAITVYIALIIILMRLSLMMHHSHLKKIKKEMEQHNYEELEHQRLLSEQRIIRLEKEKLQFEIFHKNKEISNSALELVNKNRILDELKSEILYLRSLNQSHSSPFNRLIKLIDNNLNQKDDWQLFETNFNHLNSSFYESLQTQYPGLSSKDLRTCAFLKMNLTTKELASLLNISARSLELKRFRLRKKLKLKHEENLVDFLMKYS